MRSPAGSARAEAVKAVALLLLSALAALPAAGVDYYVDNQAGDDSADGLVKGRAFRTLAKATARLRPGDTLHVAPSAVYRESLVLRQSGTAKMPITVKGNGAVISGLAPIPDESWIAKGVGLYHSPNKACWGALVPRVIDRDGREVTVASGRATRKRPEDLKAGEAVWNAEGIWYRSPDGTSPAGRGLSGYFRDSGVKIVRQSHIVVEGIVAERFANDGFNIHGDCHDLVFRDIEGRFNGDEGFSAHETAETSVCGGWFHHNGDGIADVHASETRYTDVTVEENESFGVGFHGGVHSMRDSIVRNNGGYQIVIRRDGDHSAAADSPLHSPRTHFRHVKVAGGSRASTGFLVCVDSQVYMADCAIRDVDVALRLDGGKTCVERTIVDGCRRETVQRAEGAELIGEFAR